MTLASGGMHQLEFGAEVLSQARDVLLHMFCGGRIRAKQPILCQKKKEYVHVLFLVYLCVYVKFFVGEVSYWADCSHNYGQNMAQNTS